MPDDTPQVLVFYDYVCPYAYIGKQRVDRLEGELDVRFTWLPWEIHPETAPMGEPLAGGKGIGDWLTRLADEVDATLKSPPRALNSNLALRGAEYAKDQGPETFHKYHDLAFGTVWERGEDLGDARVLRRVVEGAGMQWDPFLENVRHQAYQHRLDEVDRAAMKLGVARVPTFVFGDQRVVGNDPFEDSLKRPLRAFLERWKTLGADHATELVDDFGLVDLE